MTQELRSRVDRERAAHTHDDVLGNSYRIKAVFSHTVTSKTILRLQKDYQERISEVRGLKILDVGCGHGALSAGLLARGASYVAGIDISENYVSDAADAAKKKGFAKSTYDFKVMDAHCMLFSEDFFDIVVGNGILHHLDLPVCLAEIGRVLKPGGYALFIEPLAGSPLLRLFRRFTPRARTVDEKPLDSSDLQMISESWNVDSRYYGIVSAPVAAFTSIFLRPFPNNPLLAAADWLDRKLSSFKALKPYNQYVMLVLIKRNNVAK